MPGPKQGTARASVKIGKVAEEDMADDLTRLLCDQGHPDVDAIPEGVHEPGLVFLAEGESVDLPNGVEVGCRFRSNHGIHTSARCAFLSSP